MIERSIDVAADPDTAFVAWTEHIDTWWPPSHTQHLGTIVLTPDRFAEVWDGGERALGRVVEWSPPGRLVYDFYPGSSAEQPTRVTLTFTPIPTGTRVDIRHERHRVPADRFARSSEGFRRAWPDLEASFITFVEHR